MGRGGFMAMPIILEGREGREATLELIRNNDRVFIAYAHSDLRQARRLFKKLRAVRPDHPPESIFLDQISLAPGEDVGPEVIDGKIKECDLFVVVCGKETPGRFEVKREINIALECRSAGSLDILPIILKRVPKLPTGLDYRIQGIMLTTLFPEIARARIAIGMALTGLTAVSVVLGILFWDGIRKRDREAIKAAIEIYDASPKSALDRIYADRLCEIGKSAEDLSDDGAIQEIRSRLSKHPKRGAWREMLSGGRDPIGLAFCSDARGLAAAYPNEFFLWPSATKSSPISHRPPKNSKILGLIAHPSERRVLFEVEYQHFASAEQNAEIVIENGQAYTKNGDPLEGSEAEIFSVPCVGGVAVSLGLSREYEWKIGHDLGGEERGPSWLEANGTGLSLDTLLMKTPSEHIGKRGKELEKEDFIRGLAASPTGFVMVYEIQELVSMFDQIEYGSIYDVYAELVNLVGRRVRLTDKTNYSPTAKDLFFLDTPREDYPTGDLPEFEPAAVNDAGTHVLLGKKFVSLLPDGLIRSTDISADLSKLKDLIILERAPKILGRFSNGDLAIIDGLSGKLAHRFPVPRWVSEIAVAPDGESVALLLDKGSVVLWQLKAIGPDGWASNEWGMGLENCTG